MSRYKQLRETGYASRHARRQALVEGVEEEEAKQLAGGMRYDREQVGQAIVHMRQDIVLIIADIGELRRILLSIRLWLMATAALLGFIALAL